MVDYDFTLQYHPGKANVVADALSRKIHGLMVCLALDSWKNSVAIGDYNLEYYENQYKACAYNVIAIPSTVLQVKQSQWQDEELQQIWNQPQWGEQLDGWQLSADGFLLFKGRLVVATDHVLRGAILHEAHRSRFAIHPISTKMFHDLKQQYYWSGMKSDVAMFVKKCMTC